MLSSVACLALQYFSTLFHERYDFRKKKKRDIDDKTRVLINQVRVTVHH